MRLSLRHCFARRTAPGLAPKRPRVTPYHADLNTPLLSFGGEHWTIRDACESVSVLGGIGSGKTSTSMKALLTAYLGAGFGGVFLCAKSDAADELRKAARLVGRLGDIVPFNASVDSARMNVLDVASKLMGGTALNTSLIGVMGVVIEAGRRASGTGGGDDGDNRFFTEAALKDTARCFPILQAVYGTIRMRDVYGFLTTVPQTADEANNPQWMNGTFCGQTIGLLTDRIEAAVKEGSTDLPHLKALWNDCAEYFLGEVARLHTKTKTNVTASFSNNIHHFQIGLLNRLFCTDTTVTPQHARDGKLLLVDLPALRYGAGAVIAAVLIKYLCSLAWQSEAAGDDTRPVFIFADEAQTFLDSTDADTLSTGRSSRISVCYASQDLPTYYAKLGKSGRDVANSVQAKFGTRVFHANTCTVTNEAAANMIGKLEKFHTTQTRSTGRTSGAGGNRHDASGGYHGNHGANQSTGESTSGYMDYEYPPSNFALLKTGGPRNKGVAEAVIIRNGRRWKATGKHWLLAELKQ